MKTIYVEPSDEVQRELHELREDLEERYTNIEIDLLLIFAFVLLISARQSDNEVLFVVSLLCGIFATAFFAVHLFESWKRYKRKRRRDSSNPDERKTVA